MSLHALANHMAAQGRNGDTMLVHMTPDEVHGLHRLALANGTNITINPVTGLPEMSKLSRFLKKAAPAILGAAVNYFLPGVGSAIGSALGTSAAVGTGVAVGGITALATGSLSRGLTAGLGAYGGASLMSGITGAGAGAAQQAAIAGLGEGASQAAMNQAAAEATKNYLGMEGATAPLGAGERFMQGLSATVKDPKAFVQGMGGIGKTLQAGYAAAAPAIMADQSVPTATSMPSATPSTAYYRPYEYDPETKGLRSLGTFDAAKVNSTAITPAPAPEKPTQMANGGIVALANGGGIQFTPEQLAMFNNNQQEKVFSTLTPEQQAYTNERAKAANVDPLNFLYGVRGTQLSEDDPAGRSALSRIKDAGLYDQYVALRTDDPVGAQNIVWNVNDWSASGRDSWKDFLRNYKQSSGGISNQPSSGDIRDISRTDQAVKALFSGGINDLVYRPLSQVSQKAAAQGIANDPLNDRMQGLERMLIDRGLHDELNQYLVNAGNFGEAYKPVQTTVPVRTDDKLQHAFYDSIRNDLSETERQKAAKSLVSMLQEYEAKGPSYNSTPSSYTVGGGSIAPTTSTTPPEITATERPQPVANISPAQIFTQVSPPAPLTPSAPPPIYASAAPVMPSIPVGGRDITGMAAVRPFDWQSAQIEELPEIQQKSAQDIMTGQSLAAYQQLMGNGAAQLAPQTIRGVETITPYAYTTPTSSASSFGFLRPFFRDISSVAKPTPAYVAGTAGRTLTNILRGRFADGGAIPGYALGGMGNLGGFSDGGQLLKGPGDGVSDSIPATISDNRPARLADGEFVVPARIVSELGNGSTDAGARKLYAMMERVQKARGKTTGKNRIAVNSRAEKYLPA